MIRRHLIFHGTVQGVGFRYHAVYKARQLGLTGWVRNRYDGTVEMEAQGPEEVIDRLLLFLYGRPWIDIQHTDMKQIPLKNGEPDFRERY